MTRPQLSLASVNKILNQIGTPQKPGDKVRLLGIRGYYQDSMGTPGVNDRGIYDDALFVVYEGGTKMKSFNFNTDPSAKFKDGLASLNPGTWRFVPKKHKISKPTGYPAFGQYANVTVHRDNQGDDTGMFGINLHRGGTYGTSSEGCQTVIPEEWDEVRDLVYGILGITQADVMRNTSGLKAWTFDYVLVTRSSCEAIGVTF